MTHSRAASLAGFILCLASLVAGQLAITFWVKPGTAQNVGIVKDMGYTFTALTALIAFILWRWAKLKSNTKQSNVYYWRTKILQAIVAMFPAAFGIVYFLMAGEHVERHARTFVVMPHLVYLLTITKNEWRMSSNGE